MSVRHFFLLIVLGGQRRAETAGIHKTKHSEAPDQPTGPYRLFHVPDANEGVPGAGAEDEAVGVEADTLVAFRVFLVLDVPQQPPPARFGQVAEERETARPVRDRGGVVGQGGIIGGER